MSDVAIRAESLGKRYRIGARREGQGGLGRSITRALASPFDYLRATLRGPSEDEILWALRGISFEMARGEVLGIIGRNGAGKTTLLKILARITDPTEGEATIYGRVGSLLEVGTGFHPELTGRENVFLNGAILGMTKAEIDRKFDEIVAFSGVERFIDTQVKRYSTGMRVRLAFSVAAHLEPEILLIDEVLAVGDAGFQRKCLGKMHEFGESGRTVIFVSHSMPAISRLCDRTILLDEGRIVDDGPSDRVMAQYLQSDLGTTAERRWDDPGAAPGNELVRIRSVRVVDGEGRTVETVDVRKPVGVEVVFEVLRRELPMIPEIVVGNEEGVRVFISMDTHPRWRELPDPGSYVSTAWIPGNLLAEGTLIAGAQIVTLLSGATIREAEAPDAVAFHVVDPGEGGSAKGDFVGSWKMAVSPLLEWTLERRPSV